MASSESTKPSPQPRRADARRNVERLLDAALEQLTQNPEASMAAVARQAGVARATLYVHFPTRETLITAVTDRAIADGRDALQAAAPEEGAPAEALGRLLAAGWRTLGSYHALVAINTRLEPERLRALHEPILELLRPLLERGQASGAFDRELPLEWMLTVVLELTHAASRELAAGRLPADRAERALVASVKGALAGPVADGRPRGAKPPPTG